MQSDDNPKSRTQWAERHVEDFLGLPLVREFVLRSPQTIDGVQKEVADHLILHEGGGVLISQKCQEDPSSRDEAKTETWARKNAKGAARQLVGALRAGPRLIWCDHPRRGRVEFPAGLPPITHGIVLTEVFQPVDLQPDADDLPLSYRGTPITYLSVNDFLNLAVELRTVPELMVYLDARRALPIPDLRRIGSEQSLLEFYMLNGSLQGCAGISDAAVAVAAQEDRLSEALARKKESDLYSGLFEHVADALATRDPQYAAKLPPEWAQLFDNDPQRTNYLRLQEIIARLRLRERALLGQAFDEASRAVEGTAQGFKYRAMHFDGRPDWVFVVGASRNIERAELFRRMDTLMASAMTAYGKSRCFIVVDRDSTNYEVGLSRPDFQPRLADYELAEHFFGRLKMTSRPVGLVP